MFGTEISRTPAFLISNKPKTISKIQWNLEKVVSKDCNKEISEPSNTPPTMHPITPPCPSWCICSDNSKLLCNIYYSIIIAKHPVNLLRVLRNVKLFQFNNSSFYFYWTKKYATLLERFTETSLHISNIFHHSLKHH